MWHEWEDMKNAHTAFSERPGRKRSLVILKHRRGTIKMYHKEIKWEHVDRMHLAQNRDQGRVILNTIIRLPVPKKKTAEFHPYLWNGEILRKDSVP